MLHTQPPVLQQPIGDDLVYPGHHLVPRLKILRLRGLALHRMCKFWSTLYKGRESKMTLAQEHRQMEKMLKSNWWVRMTRSATRTALVIRVRTIQVTMPWQISGCLKTGDQLLTCTFATSTRCSSATA